MGVRSGVGKRWKKVGCLVQCKFNEHLKHPIGDFGGLDVLR